MADTDDDLDLLDADEEHDPQHEAEGEDDQDDGADGEDGLGDDLDEDSGETEAEDAVVVTIEGEENREEDTPVIRDFRRRERDKDREIKELKAKLAERESPPEQLGAKPTLDEFDFDEERFSAALADWHDNRRRVEARKAEADRQAEQAREAWNQRLATYNEDKRKLGAKDFDEAEETVRSMLPPDRQGIILDAVKDPAKVIYALGKHPDILERFAKIENPVEYIAEIARLEGRLSMRTTRSKPTPESRIKGASQGSASVDRKLERLREEANRTGDFSKVTAYRKKLGAPARS